MASETSELTFVRCPSCRSLVPASAARCRICNNALEGNAQGNAVDATRPPGRVRQKTITASADELLQAGGVGGDYAQGEQPQAQSFGGAPQGGAQEHEVVDPLADFLQEFDEPTAIPAPPPSQEVPTAAAANDDDDLDTFLDEFDPFNAGPEPVEEPTPTLLAQPPLTAEPEPLAQTGAEATFDGEGARDPFDLEPDPIGDLAAEVDDDFDLEMAPEPSREVAPPVRQAAPTPQPVPEPVPEPSRGLEQSRRPRPERHPVQEKRPNNQQSNARPTPQQGQKRAQSHHEDRGHGGRDHRPRGDDRKENRRETQRHERRGEEHRGDGHQHRQRQEERRHDHEASRSEAPVAGPKTGKMRPGRLFGWLVSFESADGRAIELREGKFFITGSSIRGTDLVIEDPSISTPHALMSVSADHGLLLQDLMSERGVFVRSGDRGQYKREDGAVELKHGDWVRFGDVEFLLTVVPGGSR